MDRVIHPPLSEHQRLRQPLTEGEQKVLNVFMDHLPIEWEIYVQPHLNGKRPDFVLLHPRLGISVFEVKDWDLDAMEYYSAEIHEGNYGLFASKNGHSFALSNPIKQVDDYRKLIYEIYCPRLAEGKGFGAITAGVIFTCATKTQVAQILEPFRCDELYRDKQPISGIEELENGSIEAIFPAVARTYSKVMREELAADLRGWLVEPDFSKTQRLPLPLNKRQQRLAETRTPLGRRHIKGPAGSGKSLILAARAAHLANEGKSVLIATFNITLWHYLRDLIVRNLNTSTNLSYIEMTHFHLWCKDVCHESYEDKAITLYRNLFENQTSTERVLAQELPTLANQLIEERGTRLFDAILIDEGQDYLPLWLKVLCKACKPDGEILFISDDTQNVYGTAQSRNEDNMNEAGIGVRPSELKQTYRLGPVTAELARSFAQTFLPKERCDPPKHTQHSLFVGKEILKWVQCNLETGPELCADEMRLLMEQTGQHSLANADITLLTEDMKSGNSITEMLKKKYRINTRNTYGKDHRRKKMAFFMGDAAIKATTVHSFKGWESRLIVVYVNNDSSEEALATIYTGLTRLKQDPEGSWMTVVCSCPNLKNFGKSFPEFIDRAN